MKRSLAILAATTACAATVAVGVVAYASDGGATTGGSIRTVPGWLADLEAVAADDSGRSTTECRLPRDLRPLPRIEDLPEPPDLLYGEQVVRDPDSGDTERLVTQAGTVSGATATELTVRSADDTTWTWVLTDETKILVGDRAGASPDVGDRVLVHGTRDGATRQADHVTDPPPDLDQFGQRLREALPYRLRELPGRLPTLRCEDGDDQGTGTAA